MRAKVFLKREAPTIVTCAGVVGVVATSVLTAKATNKANMLLEKAKKKKGDDLTTFEKVNMTAPIYIPPILMGTATISCIFGANVLNKKKQASLIAAYTMLDQTFKEYRTKVDELYGKDANEEIRNEIVKDHYPRRRCVA